MGCTPQNYRMGRVWSKGLGETRHKRRVGLSVESAMRSVVLGLLDPARCSFRQAGLTSRKENAPDPWQQEAHSKTARSSATTHVARWRDRRLRPSQEPTTLGASATGI